MTYLCIFCQNKEDRQDTETKTLVSDVCPAVVTVVIQGHTDLERSSILAEL